MTMSSSSLSSSEPPAVMMMPPDAPAHVASPAFSALGVPKVILGRYTLEQAVGRGGMGQVFRARDGSLKEPCAVKVVASESRARLERELLAGRRMRKIQRVPGVRDYDDLPDGRPFLVFDYCEGQTLAAWLARAGRPAILDVLDWAIAAADTMEAVHRAGVIHRDLSARNLILDGREVWVIDFGLARVDGEAKLTSPGMILGTWPYTAPEQLQSPDTVDGRADVYSLAMMMYRSLAGRDAMPALAEGDDRNVAAMVEAARSKANLGELVADLPARVVAAVMRGSDPDASRRFGTMKEFAAELRACREELQTGEPQTKPRRRVAGAIAMAAAAMAIVALMIWMQGQTRPIERRAPPPPTHARPLAEPSSALVSAAPACAPAASPAVSTHAGEGEKWMKDKPVAWRHRRRGAGIFSSIAARPIMDNVSSPPAEPQREEELPLWWKRSGRNP